MSDLVPWAHPSGCHDCDRQADRQTDHATSSVTIGRIYSTAMQLSDGIKLRGYLRIEAYIIKSRILYFELAVYSSLVSYS